MPRYSFSLKVGSRVVEGGGGVELADENAALMHAWFIGRALLRLPNSGGDWATGILIIDDDEGGASFALSLSDVADRTQRNSTH